MLWRGSDKEERGGEGGRGRRGREWEGVGGRGREREERKEREERDEREEREEREERGEREEKEEKGGKRGRDGKLMPDRVALRQQPYLSIQKVITVSAANSPHLSLFSCSSGRSVKWWRTSRTLLCRDREKRNNS